MRLVHEPEGGQARTLAATVETADSFLSRARGLTFRRSLPPDFALVFRFDRAATRRVHMLFVAVPLDVLWVEAGTVRRVERLRPWTGYGAARADVLVELPAGSADGVAAGDAVRLADS